MYASASTRRRFLLHGATVALGAWARRSEASDLSLVVVVNPGVSHTSLDERMLAAVYRGTTRTWSDGSAVHVFNLAALSPPRIEFDRVILKMTPTESAQFWIDKRIRGEGLPPRQVPSPELAARLVQSIAGSIVYVPDGTPLGAARVVARISGGSWRAP